MKKYLVNIYDRKTLKRKMKLIVKAESLEEAGERAMKYAGRVLGVQNGQQ